MYLDKHLNGRESDLANIIQINFFSSLVEFCFVLGVGRRQETRLHRKKKLALNCYAMENDLMGWSCHDLK